MNHTYIFYADVYLWQNFLMKSSALYLTLWYQKYLPKGIMPKIMFAALAGTVMEIMGLLSNAGYHWFIGMVHLVEIPGMILFLMGKEKKYLVKTIITGYFFILLINGVQEAVWNVFGENGNFHFFLIISCGLTLVIARSLYVQVKTEKYIFWVELQNEKSSCQIRGFYDTGNRLKEPYGGKYVHILSKEICEKLISEQEAKMLVPYHALGNTEGILEVFYMKNMKIKKGTQIFEITDAAIGIGEVQLFEGKEYEMILNESVFQQVNEKSEKMQYEHLDTG